MIGRQEECVRGNVGGWNLLRWVGHAERACDRDERRRRSLIARARQGDREREREREGEDGTRVSASESGAPFHRPAERDGRWERSAVDAAIGRASERERERERESEGGRKKKREEPRQPERRV